MTLKRAARLTLDTLIALLWLLLCGPLLLAVVVAGCAVVNLVRGRG